jgi:hypothetical protein
MFNGAPQTPRSHRRHTSRVERELDDGDRQRRIPVSKVLALSVQPIPRSEVAD